MDQHIVGYILDKGFNTIGLLDNYISFVWTDKFCDAGNVEVVVSADYPYKDKIVEDNYIYINESDRLMFIESILYESDPEDGDTITISGQSVEAFLRRRIVWNHTRLNCDLQTAIQTLLNQNVINPSDSNRKIRNITFKSTTNNNILEKKVDVEYQGENLFECIQELCDSNDVGFRMIPDFDHTSFVFELYWGNDYSYNQELNPWVVFSELYGNILDSRFLKTKKDYVTAVLILGEQKQNQNEVYDDKEKLMREYIGDNQTDLDRREIGVNTTATRQQVDEPEYTEIPPEEDAEDKLEWEIQAKQIEANNRALEQMYNQQVAEADALYEKEMQQDGINTYKEHQVTTFFDGEINAQIQFTYGKNFKLGDLVQVINSYDMEAVSRITEVTVSDDTDGYNVTPVFTSLEKDHAIK